MPVLKREIMVFKTLGSCRKKRWINSFVFKFFGIGFLLPFLNYIWIVKCHLCFVGFCWFDWYQFVKFLSFYSQFLIFSGVPRRCPQITWKFEIFDPPSLFSNRFFTPSLFLTKFESYPLPFPSIVLWTASSLNIFWTIPYTQNLNQIKKFIKSI